MNLNPCNGIKGLSPGRVGGPGSTINQLLYRLDIVLHSGHGLEVNIAPSAILTPQPGPHAIKPIQCPGSTITKFSI